MAKKYKYRHREIYKDVPIDVKANTTGDLMAKVEKARKRIDRQMIDADTTLDKFVDTYLSAYKSSTVSPDTYAFLVSVGNKIVDGIGNIRVSRIKPIMVQEFLNSCAGYKEGYVKKIYQETCQIFTHAYKNGLLSIDYATILEQPRGRPSDTGRSLTPRERKALLEVLPGHRGEIFCKLMLYCGIRPGEAMALQWKDIDFNAATLTVNKSYKRSGHIGIPKSEAAYRTIPIPMHLIPLLAEHRAGPMQRVCVNSDGKSYNENSRRAMWKSVKRAMNIAMGCRVKNRKLLPPLPLDDKFDMYFLRHTYCTDLERAGVPINVARRLMGHANINITAKIYTHYNDESIERARQMIDSAAM